VNETAAMMLFMAMTTTATNYRVAPIGTYLADDVVSANLDQETCAREKGRYDSAQAQCTVTNPDGRMVTLSLLDRQIVVRVETKFGDSVMTDFTGVIVDQYRDELVAREAILRDPRANNQELSGLPVIERGGRDSCLLRIKFHAAGSDGRASGRIDISPSTRCDRRLAITGAAKKS